jgi:hypothetical protein
MPNLLNSVWTYSLSWRKAEKVRGALCAAVKQADWAFPVDRSSIRVFIFYSATKSNFFEINARQNCVKYITIPFGLNKYQGV